MYVLQWVLGVGDERDSGVYSVKNVDLNSNVGVDGVGNSFPAPSHTHQLLVVFLSLMLYRVLWLQTTV